MSLQAPVPIQAESFPLSSSPPSPVVEMGNPTLHAWHPRSPLVSPDSRPPSEPFHRAVSPTLGNPALTRSEGAVRTEEHTHILPRMALPAQPWTDDPRVTYYMHALTRYYVHVWMSGRGQGLA